MTGTITCTVDSSEFNLMMATLRKIVPQDAAEFLRDETARLAEECARQLSNRARNKGGLSRDVRSVFRPMPKVFKQKSKMEGTAGMKWLYAAPNALVGVTASRFHDDHSAEDMLKYFYKSKGTLPQNAWSEIGTIEIKARATRFHGRIPKHQHVMELRRHVVPKASYGKFFQLMKAKYGRLEATFAKTSQILRTGSVKLKAYITRHLHDANLANITELMGLANKNAPSIQFGSYAPGIENYDAEIENALAIRVDKMERRFKLILSDYSEDVLRSVAPRSAAKRFGVIE